MIRWDEWRGSMDGRPSMLIKRLVNAFGWRVDLHKIMRADDLDCFHTHPANAFRFILWGGYSEELGSGEIVSWSPLRFGIIKPELEHRISYLPRKVSYSLWIRAPKIAEIKVRGC